MTVLASIWRNVYGGDTLWRGALMMDPQSGVPGRRALQNKASMSNRPKAMAIRPILLYIDILLGRVGWLDEDVA